MSRRALRLLAACLLCAAPALRAGAIELEGTWYVLIHYKDENAENAELERWDDRVWVFAKEGTRLRWTEYPIVVFDDESGRFERRSTGQYARILHFWEPSPVQLTDIRDGLKVNTRGSKTKTLRGSDAKGWTSGQRAASASVSVLTYSENWSIAGLPAQPVFSRSDVMGGGSSDSLEGLTRYSTEEVREDGALLVGGFERDESRRGRFQMLRSGPIGSLEKKSQEEIQRQAVLRGLEQSGEVRELTARELDKQLAAVGIAISASERDALVTQSLGLFARGVGQEEIGAQIATDLRQRLAKVGQPGARHDDAARYRWPFDAKEPALLLASEDGLSFALPEKTPVLAAREGVVTRVVDGYAGPPKPGTADWNAVYVRHPDGSFAVYALLASGLSVKPDQAVKAGDVLGAAGPPRERASLSFAVLRLDGEGRSQPVAVRFAGPTPEGVTPVAGSAYGGR